LITAYFSTNIKSHLINNLEKESFGSPFYFTSAHSPIRFILVYSTWFARND